jgi:hydroxyacylglutathione hydrolase
MKIYQKYTGSSYRNFCYLLQNTEKNEIWCFDPWDGEQVETWMDEIGGTLKGIINTHEHWDHVQGNEYLKKRHQCAIYAHKRGKGKVPGATNFLVEGDKLVIDESTHLLVWDTPGHTFAHLCLLLVVEGTEQAIFTGDTLFNAGVGNCHNGGDPEVLYETIDQRFQGLADDIKVYPGHEYLGNNLRFTLEREPGNNEAQKMLGQWEKSSPEDSPIVTNMAQEKEINTFLRLNNAEVMEGLAISGPKGPGQRKEVFLRLRELRNNW